MKCCPNCIGDRGLRKNIFPTLTSETGGCDYCQSEGVLILEPSRLAEVFGSLINIYEPNEHGQLLVRWLKEDWGMFDHARMEDSLAKDLLAEILSELNRFAVFACESIAPHHQ